MADTHALAARLDATDALSAAWRPSILAVPREHFIPDRIWGSDNHGRDDEPIDRAAQPDRWMDAVYDNTVLVTQFDDGHTAWPTVGQRATSSASMPSAVVGMLDALDVRDDQRVLEIGTGSGWNAALLAHQLGADLVTTIEVDAGLADRARAALGRSRYPVEVVTGDGIDGYKPGAPYDRVIATATVRVGDVPYAWVAQTRPGGVIIAPMRTELTSGPVVRFLVDEHGTATGRPVPLYVGFMELRAHRTAATATVDWNSPDAEDRTTDVEPWTILNNLDQRWVVGLRLGSCRWEHRPPRDSRPHLLRLWDVSSGSWATAAYGRDPGPYTIRQHGSRRLWDEAEAAYRWWQAAGSPPVEAWRFAVGPDGQSVELC